MADDVADVSMPDGIEVDEAAAYFGVFESSDALHQMMDMPREEAFEKFFALLSDLVLKPGDFDFEEASVRLNINLLQMKQSYYKKSQILCDC